MTIKVRLEDGTEEKFSRSNIIGSLEAVGLDHKTAKQIAGNVEKHLGITEHEIKVKIFEKLDSIDSMIADDYMRTKKVHVNSETFGVKDNALLPGFLMEYLDLRNGDKVDVIHGDKRIIVHAFQVDDKYHSNAHHDMIFLSKANIKEMKIKDKALVAVCKHPK